MCPIENNSGVHSKQRSQVDRKKTTADQLAQHCDLYNNSAVESYKVEDVTDKNKVRILEE